MKSEISTKELEKIAGLSESRLRQIASGGSIPSPADGKWPHPQTLQQLFKFYRQRNELKPLENAKLRQLEANAELAEMQLAETKRDLLPTEKVYRHMDKMGTALKTGILASNLMPAEKRDLLSELQRLVAAIPDAG